MASVNTYVIRSGINPDLVLAAVHDRVVLQWFDPDSGAQKWDAGYGPGPLGSAQFVNRATGNGMTADSMSQGSGIGVSGGGDVLEFASTGLWGALRPAANTNLNLNVPDSRFAIGTPIVLWGWGGGAPNEIWQLQDVRDILPYPRTRCAAFPGTSKLVLGPDTQESYALIPGGVPPPAGAIYTAVKWACGAYSFQNETTGRYICFQGDDRALVAQPSMRMEALWTAAPSPTRYVAVRPPWRSEMNWNAMGSGTPRAGTIVGAWSWGGGQANEIWEFFSQTSGSWQNWIPR